MSKYPSHPVLCPYGNHPIFIRESGTIVAHYADAAPGQVRCKGSGRQYCDCHLHEQQVCDICQFANNPEAFYAMKDAELAEPYKPNSDPAWLRKMADAEDGCDVSVGARPIVCNLSLPGTYVACGDHYYACVRGDEECPACARLAAERVRRVRYQDIVYAVCNDLDMCLCNSVSGTRLIATKEDVIPALRRALRAFGYVPAERNTSVPPPTDMSRASEVK